MQRLKLLAAFILSAGIMAPLLIATTPALASSCSPLPSGVGNASTSVNIPATGTYRIWAHIYSPSSQANAFDLQIAGTSYCQLTIGGSSLPAGAFSWVDYPQVALAQGTYTLNLAGTASGVGVDKLLFTEDISCEPHADGTNCEPETTTSTPTPTSPTPPPAAGVGANSSPIPSPSAPTGSGSSSGKKVLSPLGTAGVLTASIFIIVLGGLIFWNLRPRKSAEPAGDGPVPTTVPGQAAPILKQNGSFHEPALLALMVVSVIGGAVAIMTFAASVYFVAVQLTTASTTSGASIVANTGAIGGRMVVFNVASPGSGGGSNGGGGGSPSPTPSSSACPSGQARANDGSCVALPSGTTKLAFDDEFNGSSVDTSLWDVINAHGDTSNNEPECYVPGNVGESGGYLNETVAHQNVTCPGDASNGNTGTMSSSYPSGAVQMHTYSFTYGTVVVRAKFSGGTGPWPAIWMLGTNCQQPNYLVTRTCNWPNPGGQELDMTEILGSNHSSVNQQIHANTGNPGCRPTTSDVSQNWHIYTLEWSSSKVVFKIDGTTTCTLTSSVPTSAMFLIINLAIGGIGGGSINNGTLPQTSSFDYVRIFQ